jgi:hypothetical protein
MNAIANAEPLQIAKRRDLRVTRGSKNFVALIEKEA